MKEIVLTIIAILGIAAAASAVKPETVTLSLGQQKTSRAGKITIKFISVVEDSRCPVGVDCIWAGNAKIKIALKKGKKAATSFELNSTLKPEVVEYEGYDIRLADLTPRPGEKGGAAPARQAAMLSISKHDK